MNIPKVTIMQEGVSKRAYIDGKEVNGLTAATDVRVRLDEVSVVDFEIMLVDGFLELCDSDIRIKAHPGTLQEATCIIRDKPLKEGDLYDGFVTNILGALMPKEHYADGGESKIYAEYGAKYLAEEISNRIIGLEDEQL